MESSQFTNQQLPDGGFERLECQGATSETYCVILEEKAIFLCTMAVRRIEKKRGYE